MQPPRHIDEDFFLMNSLTGLILDAFCINAVILSSEQ